MPAAREDPTNISGVAKDSRLPLERCYSAEGQRRSESREVQSETISGKTGNGGALAAALVLGRGQGQLVMDGQR